VSIGPAPTTGKPTVVPMAIEVMEKPYREIKIGVGYNTEEEFRAQAQWRHLNWLGGGRQLALQGEYSSITAGGVAELIQPHFLTPRTKAVLTFKYEQQEEDTFDRNYSRFTPRVDHQFSPTLSGFLGFRLEYDNLYDIAPATERALGGVRKEGGVSGPAMVSSEYRQPFDPKGAILSFCLSKRASFGARLSIHQDQRRGKALLRDRRTPFGRLKLGLGRARRRSFPSSAVLRQR
jgi:outer membrane protein assembly factor BamA